MNKHFLGTILISWGRYYPVYFLYEHLSLKVYTNKSCRIEELNKEPPSGTLCQEIEDAPEELCNCMAEN